MQHRGVLKPYLSTKCPKLRQHGVPRPSAPRTSDLGMDYAAVAREAAADCRPGCSRGRRGSYCLPALAPAVSGATLRPIAIEPVAQLLAGLEEQHRLLRH